MIYTLYGSENFLIKKEIENIIEKNKIDTLNMSIYDFNETPLKNILEDVLTISLFEERKLVIVENAYFLTGSPAKEKQDNIEDLINYLDHINPDCILILTSNNEKLDERKKIVKKLHQVSTIKDFNNRKSGIDYAKELLKGYEINQTDLYLLIDRVGNDLGILEQEINKIKLYKGNNNHILKEDIINLTAKNIEIDIFDLIDKIVNKDKEKAIEIYREMLKRNEEPIKILIILANQFRIMYQAKELYNKGYSGNDIASILGIHPYRIKLALEKVYKYKSETLLHYLSLLADLDYDIKLGNKEAALALELFILEGE